MRTRRHYNCFCFLACTISLFLLNGCAKPYGLGDVDSQGSLKVVVFDKVRFNELFEATHEVLEGAGLKVVEEIVQPKFNIFVTIARGKDIDTVKVRIRSLSETSHELGIFTSSERGASEEQAFNREFRQQLERRLYRQVN